MTRKEWIKAYGAWSAVCFFWGTTYLAIRVGVQALPPALFAGIRHVSAGFCLLLYLRLKGRPWPPRAEIPHMVVVGIALLVMANGLVVWAEQWVPSGLTCLLGATLPLWVAGFEAFIPRGQKLNLIKTLGILIGFGGVVVLFAPDLKSGLDPAYFRGILGLLLATLCWAGGSVYSKYHPIKTPPLMAAAMQMLIAGIILILIGTVLGQFQRFTFNFKGLAAMAYLILFGSIIGYGAFIYALAKLPAAKVAMYAYINPIVAIFFGWLILAEHVDGLVLLAAAIILSGVVLVNSSRNESTLTASGRVSS